ncbi:MAG TPA: ABC transporter ATP-binding protein [Acidobacteriota bacterium]
MTNSDRSEREEPKKAPPDTSILVERLVKIFRIYRRPGDRIRELLHAGRRKYRVDFWALRNLSFQVIRGSTIGVVGQNGSGKSTLLKILCRLMLPSSGKVEISGRVSSLIELGTGFHPEFTGRSNVYLNASLMGFTREEIDDRFGRIVEFSGLKDFIDRPLKTYSSGMWVRLAFATAVCVDPEILLVDEALAVGDALFQQKCIRRLIEFQKQGATILFVSHDMSSVRTLCGRALLLDQGELLADGPPAKITEDYIALLAQKSSGDQLKFRSGEFEREQDAARQHRRYGSFTSEIKLVELLNSNGQKARAIVSGDQGTIRLQVLFHETMENPTIGILLRDRLGNDVFGTNTYYHRCRIRVEPEELLVVDFGMQMNLGPGDYFLTVAVHSDRDHFEDCRDWIDNVLDFRVLPTTPEFIGLARLEPKVTIQTVSSEKIRVSRGR